MKKLTEGLFIGTVEDTHSLDPEEWRLINVSKTLHYKIHGWDFKQDVRDEKEYVYAESHDWVTVNWVDAVDPKYFDYKGQGLTVVRDILQFMDKNYREGKNLIIVCDQGVSRSPTIALAFMCKRLKLWNSNNFKDAVKIFTATYYPDYKPGEGISLFFTKIWKNI